MMRKILAALLAFTTLSASAQQTVQPPAGSNWQHVQVLPVGTSLYVNAQTRHTACKLKSDDADTLTCTDAGKDVVFQRTEIFTIKISRRGRSALIGAAPGGALLISGGIGLAVDNNSLGAGAAGVYGIVIALIGALIGELTDFSRSTVYKAP